MSKETRTRIIEKIDSVGVEIAYPTVHPDLRDPQSVRGYYSSINISAVDHFSNMVSTARFNSQQWWQMKSGHFARGDNSPLEASVLWPRYPEVHDLWCIWRNVGQELSHAFDGTGRRYDATGNQTDWWDNESVSEFKSRTKCFIEQYDDLTVAAADEAMGSYRGNQSLHVNAQLTLNENIVDLSGLSAAYLAWRKQERSQPSSAPS
ncbi:hypothetical protein BBP40_002696 [Aspergillus hancockii]|nr:hypothetical protein BBP40_002696 [Aspergillus hancockii]